MFKSLSRILGVFALVAVIAGACLYWPALTSLVHGRAGVSVAGAQPAPEAPVVPRFEVISLFAPSVILDLPAAVDQELVQTEFTGNGRERMHMNVTNKGGQHVRIHVPAGLVFQNNLNSVVTLRPHDIDLKPGEFKEADLQTAALSSANQIVDGGFSLTTNTEPKISRLLNFLRQHPEVSQAAVQTSVLELTENLPVSAFAKFAAAGGELPSRFDNTAFKVEVGDIISALTVLKTIGFRDDQLALTIDPQLKIEAMIDPLSHATAMRYYGITQQTEWEYWKHHLLQGDPSTRHYALYGIARFYPDVALQMLPMWVRETRTNPVYRLSAVQALAETQREEAVSILRQLEHEFGMLTDIGRAAHNAANVLVARLNNNPASKVAFRGTQDLPKIAVASVR